LSALSLAALTFAQNALDTGVHGGQPVRFSSPEIDQYLLNVGLDRPLPWCAAFVYSCFEQACADLCDADPEGPHPTNPCPRTASALHLFSEAPVDAQIFPPAPGDVFVLVHPDGIHGHCGFVEAVSPDGNEITTVEGDTNAAGSSTGDAVGRHVWTPSDGTRGRLLGYLSLG